MNSVPDFIATSPMASGRLELPRPFGHRLLRPTRLPFRHEALNLEDILLASEGRMQPREGLQRVGQQVHPCRLSVALPVAVRGKKRTKANGTQWSISQSMVRLEQVLRDLHEAVNWIPQAESAAESEPLKAGLPPNVGATVSEPKAQPRRAAQPPISGRRRTGPRPLSAILPEVLVGSP